MDKDAIVYQDSRYTLGQRDEKPYIMIDGKTYMLTCHPYEPCLYITDDGGTITAVRNAFDPREVLACAESGRIFTSITGFEYDAHDFCRMVEYAAGMGNIGIEVAEKVFDGREKKKNTDTVSRTADEARVSKGVFLCPDGVSVIEDDPFYKVALEYPCCVIDYCLVKNGLPYSGIGSHWAALVCAALRIIAEDRELSFYEGKITAKKITVNELFAPVSSSGEKLNYRRAFLHPPYPDGSADRDFERLNDALFPEGREQLEVFEWSTDWSNYFDDGHEWWGALCYTVYDKSLDRFAVIMASATD